MPTAENALLQYEGGQTFNAFEALTDSGDQKKFTSSKTLWSKKAGKTPIVRPNGLITGGAVSPAASTNKNQVDVTALSCYLVGVKTSVSAGTDLACTRGVTNGYIINSITVNSGGALAVVAGTENTAHSETRGAAGGPPLIPVGSIEIAQVRFTATAAAAVLATEIFDTIGTHVERWDDPLWDIDHSSGAITFLAALPKIHTGSVPKAVYAEFYDPTFSTISIATDFVPPENSHSVNSTQVYGTTLGSVAASLGQGSFTAFLEDGVSDPIVALKDQVLWFKFFPDRNKTNYILAQGKLGIGRSFPAGDNMQAACTVSAEAVSKDVVV